MDQEFMIDKNKGNRYCLAILSIDICVGCRLIERNDAFFFL